MSDECPSSQVTQNFFSSPFHLIANPILRGIVWLMGILAFIGNMVSPLLAAYTLFQTLAICFHIQI